jgi:ribosome-associated protein
MDPTQANAPNAPALQRPSKTQLKRASHELQVLGAELAQLSAAERATLDLPDALRAAIDELGRTRSHEGRRRQLQYVGRLMRNVDAGPLREAIARAKLPAAQDALALHRLERWRDELIADDAALGRLVAQAPAIDVPALRALVHAARRDAAATGTRRARSYRALFQLLKENLPLE